MNVDAEESLVKIPRGTTSGAEMPTSGKQKYGLPAGGIQDSRIGIATDSPCRKIVSNGLGREEGSTSLPCLKRFNRSQIYQPSIRIRPQLSAFRIKPGPE